MSMMNAVLDRGLVPDPALRWGIRRRCRGRLRSLDLSPSEQDQAEARFARELREMPIAVETDAANEQHYEVPSEFYRLVLGPRLKYSCGLWTEATESLGQAEEAMLELYAERAQVQEDMDILDLGCGWGSLSLYLAERFRRSRITGVSNSSTQREWILGRARRLGLDNLEILTCDVNELELDRSFDRIMSIEMFEHVKNYPALMRKVHELLRPGGLLFAHMFTHRYRSYHFEITSDDDWMARHFFTGGTMASQELLPRCAGDLMLQQRWTVDGRHYEKTSNAWLENLDRNRDEVLEIFAKSYGADQAKVWLNRWRLFFLACAELFGIDEGQSWQVTHYLFQR